MTAKPSNNSGGDARLAHIPHMIIIEMTAAVGFGTFTLEAPEPGVMFGPTVKDTSGARPRARQDRRQARQGARPKVGAPVGQSVGAPGPWLPKCGIDVFFISLWGKAGCYPIGFNGGKAVCYPMGLSI